MDCKIRLLLLFLLWFATIIKVLEEVTSCHEKITKFHMIIW